MGASYYAFAVIGCDVTGKLYREVEKMTACAHSGGSRNIHGATPLPRFCPQCGKRQTRTEQAPIDAFNAVDYTLNGLKVEMLYNPSRQFAGIVVMASDYLGDATRMAIPLDGFNERAEIVKQALDEIGLWDPDSFGLWSLVRVS